MDKYLSPDFWHKSAEAAIAHAFAILLILVFFIIIRLVAYRLIDRVMRSITAREKSTPLVSAGRVRTLAGLMKSTIFYVLVVVCGIMLMGEFGGNAVKVLAPLLTAAGVAGVAIAFGAQKLVKDVLSGFFIVLENQYSVGDYVSIGTVTGTVHELGMRITELRDDMGKMVIIPNGDISQVINHSRGPLQAVVDISVVPKTDLEKLRELIDSAGQDVMEKEEGVLSAPKSNGLVALDAAKMTIRVSGEVNTGRQFAVQNALREAIRARLQEAGIELAYENVMKQV